MSQEFLPPPPASNPPPPPPQNYKPGQSLCHRNLLDIVDATASPVRQISAIVSIDCSVLFSLFAEVGSAQRLGPQHVQKRHHQCSSTKVMRCRIICYVHQHSRRCLLQSFCLSKPKINYDAKCKDVDPSLGYDGTILHQRAALVSSRY